MSLGGSGAAQREKIDRFGLAPFFEAIVIEGELGCGKPDPRSFTRAVDALGAHAGDACMVGADLAGAQSLGIRAIWRDAGRSGLPAGSPVRPDATVLEFHEVPDLVLRGRALGLPGRKTSPPEIRPRRSGRDS